MDGYIIKHNKKTDNTEMLQTVSIHPKKTILKRPRFDKDKDITAFYSWIAQNLKYPKGLENKDAKSSSSLQ